MKLIRTNRHTKGIDITLRLPWFKAKRKPVSESARKHMSEAQKRRRQQ